MNIYGWCGVFGAGLIAAGALAVWWDWKHPYPIDFTEFRSDFWSRVKGE